MLSCKNNKIGSRRMRESSNDDGTLKIVLALACKCECCGAAKNTQQDGNYESAR